MSLPGRKWGLVYNLYRILWTSIDWVYPPRCGGCGSRGSRWCDRCQQSVRAVPHPVCERCGRSQRQPGLCPVCRSSPAPLAARSWAMYEGGIRNAIHRLKYKGDITLGEILARPLIRYFRDLDWPVDLVTAVPVGLDRKAQRGYNQAELIAQPLAWGSHLAYQPRALEKIRETRTQVGLSFAERRMNISGAFRARPDLVENKTVLVVDDVLTSGATLDACAQALLHAGATRVFGLTLAQAKSAADHSLLQERRREGDVQPTAQSGGKWK